MIDAVIWFDGSNQSWTECISVILVLCNTIKGNLAITYRNFLHQIVVDDLKIYLQNTVYLTLIYVSIILAITCFFSKQRWYIYMFIDLATDNVFDVIYYKEDKVWIAIIVWWSLIIVPNILSFSPNSWYTMSFDLELVSRHNNTSRLELSISST